MKPTGSDSEHSQELKRWTRDGILAFSWNRFESFEKLILLPSLQERLSRCAELFLRGEADYHQLELPWRQGLFFFGPSGSGKTAASRGLARKLQFEHLTLPAHEILNSHLFESALFDATRYSKRVVVLEDVDLMLKRMEPEVFFTLLDHAMNHREGLFWIATSRHAENTPKTQLLRPGRFDEAVRLEPPQAELRKQLLTRLLEMHTSQEEVIPSLLLEWVELTQGLSFSHFEELRQVKARMRMENREPAEGEAELKSYIEDQLISGDRLGGLSDETERVQERVQQVDPRILMAALTITDVFRTLIEKVIGDAAEENKTDAESSTQE